MRTNEHLIHTFKADKNKEGASKRLKAELPCLKPFIVRIKTLNEVLTHPLFIAYSNWNYSNAFFTTSAKGVVECPISLDSCFPSPNKSFLEALTSQPAIACANPSERPKLFNAFAYSTSDKFL